MILHLQSVPLSASSLAFCFLVLCFLSALLLSISALRQVLVSSPVSQIHPFTIFLPSITLPWNRLTFSCRPSLSCSLSLPPHCFSVMMQLLSIHQGLKLYMEDSRHFLADSHLTFVSLIFLLFFFWTRQHQSSAWLQLGLIGCISAEC